MAVVVLAVVVFVAVLCVTSVCASLCCVRACLSCNLLYITWLFTMDVCSDVVAWKTHEVPFRGKESKAVKPPTVIQQWKGLGVTEVSSPAAV